MHANIDTLREELTSLTYKIGEPHRFPVYEPKKREISEMPFRDRVAEHAVCNIIEPIFDKVFLPQSYACRKGKGTHIAARDLQAELRRGKGLFWFLKTDWSKYFLSVLRKLIHIEFSRKISCHKTLALLHILLPVRKAGLEIGRLISQLSANIEGHIIDRWVVHSMGIKKFFRYMDDIVFIDKSKETLIHIRDELAKFAKGVANLHYSHWTLGKEIQGINFVGYRVWRTHKLLRKDSVARAKRKIKKLTGLSKERFIASWLGHAKHANTHNLLNRLELI